MDEIFLKNLALEKFREKKFLQNVYYYQHSFGTIIKGIVFYFSYIKLLLTTSQVILTNECEMFFFNAEKYKV